MKMKLFYVVRSVEFGGSDVQCIAGPFPDASDAHEVINKIIGRHDYFVVSHIIDVKSQ